MLQNKKLIILSIPVFILYILFLYGVVNIILMAFGINNIFEINNLDIQFIKKIFLDKTIIISFINTFLVSFISALLSVILGILISLYLIKQNIYNHNILYITIPIPYIVVAMMFIIMFAQNGFLSRISYHLGFIKNSYDFPMLINDKYNIGIIIAYIFKSTGYILSVIYILLNKTNIKYYEVSKVMGLNYKKYIFDIILPINIKSIISNFLILYSYFFGAFELPYLLGNTKYKLLPVIAYEKYLNPNLNNRPEFYAINFIMLLFGIVNIIIYKKIIGVKYE